MDVAGVHCCHSAVIHTVVAAVISFNESYTVRRIRSVQYGALLLVSKEFLIKNTRKKTY